MKKIHYCFFALFLFFGCQNPKSNSSKFTFGVWGNYQDRSNKEWFEYFDKYTDAGITDYFIQGSRENIQKLANIVKGRNINLHAWVWVMNRPGDMVAAEHPEWYSVNRNGQNSNDYRPYVNYYRWVSPFSEGARTHIKKVMESYAEIEGIASVHLDYVRYCDVILPKMLQPKYGLNQTTEMPEYDFGYHPNAIKGFKEKYGVDPFSLDHPEESMEWRQFRLDKLTSLVNEIAEIVHSKGKKLSAAVFPYPEISRKMVRQDWSAGDLDIACPMNYHNFYGEELDWIKTSVSNGVGETERKLDYRSGLFIGSLSPDELKIAIGQSREGGANGVVLFSVNALTEEHLDMIKLIQ